MVAVIIIASVAAVALTICCWCPSSPIYRCVWCVKKTVPPPGEATPPQPSPPQMQEQLPVPPIGGQTPGPPMGGQTPGPPMGGQTPGLPGQTPGLPMGGQSPGPPGRAD